VVVFDGWKGGTGPETSSVRGGVKVIYSGLGERADGVIKRLLSSERRAWIVVSSDREIAAHAWATGSIPIGAEQFLLFLEGEKTGEYAGARVFSDEEDGDAESTRKGSSRQLSKKEKAIQRALGKL
jgi:predicted RNA-binding protein with PIN domain